MTREEAIKVLSDIDRAWRNFSQEEYVALEMAIKALEQEPKALIEKLEKYKVSPDYIYDYFAYNKAINDVICLIKEYLEVSE